MEAESVPSTPMATPAKPVDGLLSTTDSKASTTAGKQLTRDQLLEYIKKQKLVIKRLEKENEILTKKELDSISPVKPAGGDPPNSNPNSGEAKPRQTAVATATASASGLQQAVKAPDTATEYDRRVLRVIILRISDIVTNSEIGKRSILSKRNVFALWRHKSALQGAAQAVHRHYDEVKVRTAELEQKNAKLKSLLARSHQANQRNAEDSSVLKKNQREALMELKNIKQKDESERLTLMESLRMQSIQSAFHNDIELSIQKAAEELLSQQRMLLSQQQQAMNVNATTSNTPSRSKHGTSTQITPSSSSSSSSSSYAAAAEAMEETIRDKESTINSLKHENISLKEEIEKYQIKNTNLGLLIDSVNDKLSCSEQQNNALLKRIEELNSVVSELEVELEITLTNRGRIVKELEVIAENNANKRLEDIQNELSESRSRSLGLEKRIIMLSEECDRLRSDNDKLKSSQTCYINQSAELDRLRASLSDLKRQYMRSGTMGGVLSKAARERESNHPLVLAVHSIIEMSQDSSRQCVEYCDRIVSLEKQIVFVTTKYKFEVPYLWSLCSGLLGVLQERVSSRCRGGGKNSLLTHLDVLNTQIEAAQKSSSVSGMQPLVYETSSITITPGKDITIPIIITTNNDDNNNNNNNNNNNKYNTVSTASGPVSDVVIEWKYSGDGCHVIALTLVDDAEEVSLNSHSTSSSGGKEFTGRYRISQEGRGRTRAIKFKNPSWGQVTIGYSVQLKSSEMYGKTDKGTVVAPHDLSRLVSTRDGISAMLNEGDRLLERLVISTRQALHSYKRSQGAFLTDLFSSGTGADAVKKLVGEQEACRTRLLKLHKAVATTTGYLLNTSHSKPASSSFGPLTSTSNNNHNNNTTTFAPQQPIDASFTCDSVIIKASDEFRLVIPSDVTRSTCSLTYEFYLNTDKGKKRTTNNNSNNTTTTNNTNSSSSGSSGNSGGTKKGAMDIGFSILERLQNGTFRQLVGYKRVGVGGEMNCIIWTRDETSSRDQNSNSSNNSDDGSIIFLFDNTYSYFRSKDVRYSVKVESIAATPNPNPNTGDLVYFTEASSAAESFSDESSAPSAAIAEPDEISDSLLLVCREALEYVEAVDELLATR